MKEKSGPSVCTMRALMTDQQLQAVGHYLSAIVRTDRMTFPFPFSWKWRSWKLKEAIVGTVRDGISKLIGFKPAITGSPTTASSFQDLIATTKAIVRFNRAHHQIRKGQMCPLDWRRYDPPVGDQGERCEQRKEKKMMKSIRSFSYKGLCDRDFIHFLSFLLLWALTWA